MSSIPLEHSLPICTFPEDTLPTYFFTYDSLPAIASARPPSASPQANAGRAQARRAGHNHFIFDREEKSLWLNFFDLVGNFKIDGIRKKAIKIAARDRKVALDRKRDWLARNSI